jgi:hypothetical protein
MERTEPKTRDLSHEIDEDFFSDRTRDAAFGAKLVPAVAVSALDLDTALARCGALLFYMARGSSAVDGCQGVRDTGWMTVADPVCAWVDLGVQIALPTCWAHFSMATVRYLEPGR